MDVGVLLQQLENTPGVVVLITNKVRTRCYARSLCSYGMIGIMWTVALVFHTAKLCSNWCPQSS